MNNGRAVSRRFALLALLLAVAGTVLPLVSPQVTAQEAENEQIPPWVHEEMEGATDPNRGPSRPPPEAREGAAMAYHPPSERTVLFGGSCDDTVSSEAFSLGNAAGDAHDEAHSALDPYDDGNLPSGDREVRSAVKTADDEAHKAKNDVDGTVGGVDNFVHNLNTEPIKEQHDQAHAAHEQSRSSFNDADKEAHGVIDGVIGEEGGDGDGGGGDGDSPIKDADEEAHRSTKGTNVDPCPMFESLADTWTWDGKTWTEITPETTPPARHGAGLAFWTDPDPKGAGKLILFGGESCLSDREGLLDPADRRCERLADTWTWDGTTWTEVTPEKDGSPCKQEAEPQGGQSSNCISPPKGQLVMAEHGAANRVVLVVGTGTWTWDGVRWTNVTPELAGSPCEQDPSPQSQCQSPTHGTNHSAAMAEHGATGRVLLHEGCIGTNQCVPQGTWTWDGKTWTKEENKENGKKEARPQSTGAMAYLPDTKETVLLTGNDFGMETWTWNGKRWIFRSTPERPPEGGALAYHGPSRQVVLLRPVGTLQAVQYPEAPTTATSGGSWSQTWTWAGSGHPDTSLRQIRITMRLEPDTIPADGISTTVAWIKVTVRGVPWPTASVRLDTDGDATMTGNGANGDVPSDEPGVYGKMIGAGKQIGTQTIVAKVWLSPIQGPAAVLTGPHTHMGAASAVLTQTALPDCPPSSQPGDVWSDLDPSFGCGGIVKFVARPDEGNDLYSPRILVHGDGVLLTNKYVRRFKENGSVDTSFGRHGVLVDENGEPEMAGAFVDRQDRIVVITCAEGPEGQCSIRRLLPNGSPDSSFAGGRRVPIDFRSASGKFNAWQVLVQADGKPLVIGVISCPPRGCDERSGPALARFTRTGEPDTSFGPYGEGYAVTPRGEHGISPAAGMEGTYAYGKSALQADGKLVAAGSLESVSAATCEPANLNPKCFFVVARYNIDVEGKQDGTLDETFNPCAGGQPPCGGVAMTDFPRGNASSHSLDIQPHDGKIVLVGEYWRNGRVGFALARYNVNAPPLMVNGQEVPGPADGTLDQTFNPCVPADPPCGGMLVTESFPGWNPRSYGPYFGTIDSARGRDVVVQPDGKILAAGYGPYAGGDWIIARYNADGTLDTCNTPGFVRTQIELDNQAGSLALQEDGKVLLAGLRGRGTFRSAVGRYLGASVPSPSPPTEVTVHGATVNEPTGGQTQAPFEIKLKLDAPACEATSLDYATEDQTATAGQDYAATRGTVVFQKGDQEKTVTVPVLADDVKEDPETFKLAVSNPLAIADPTNPRKLKLPARVAEGQAEILDMKPQGKIPGELPRKDGPPGISVSDTSVVEGNTGVTKAAFNVALSKAAQQKVTVDYTTADGSAKQGDDYRSSSGTLSFEPGQTSKTITVDVMTGAAPEPTEAFNVALSSPVNATLLRPGATGTIYDDDSASPQGFQGPNRQTQAAALLAPGTQLPPAVPAPSLQAQAQQQAQQQLNQQLNQQVQQHAQGQVAAAAMLEREREVQVEEAGLDPRDAAGREYLASARRSSPVLALAVAWAGALMAFGAGVSVMRGRSWAPARVVSGSKPLKRPNERN